MFIPEQCSSTFATTYSSGSSTQPKIVTTDLRGMCTARHTGTSASAPIAAAIAALVLDANPNLSWRDMQHIIVQSARKRDLKADDWKVNGVGRWYSHSFGYGIMDAGRMVELAKNWKNVKSQEEYSKIIIHRANKNAHLRTGFFLSLEKL